MSCARRLPPSRSSPFRSAAPSARRFIAALLGLTLLPNSGRPRQRWRRFASSLPANYALMASCSTGTVSFASTPRAAEPQDGLSWIERTFTGSSTRERAPWQGNAWILNARTRGVVWELREAGDLSGRRPLREFDGDVRLPAGLYEVHYASYPDGWSSKHQRNRGWFNIRDRVRSLTENFGVTVTGAGRRATRRSSRKRAPTQQGGVHLVDERARIRRRPRRLFDR